jgi:hypothetical protein
VDGRFEAARRTGGAVVKEFWVVAAVAIGGSLLYALVGVIVVRRIHRGAILEGHNDVLAPVFATVGTVYAVILAFLLFGVWERYGAARALVADEAATLGTLYRQTSAMPSDEQPAMRRLLRSYAQIVVDEEWDVQEENGTLSPKASKVIADVYRVIGATDPAIASLPIYSPFLGNVSVLASDRSKRDFLNQEELPSILWTSLIVGGFVVVGMAFLLYMERTWPHVAMVCVMAAFIGGILFTTYTLDSPFSGWYALDAGPFESALEDFKAIDAGG